MSLILLAVACLIAAAVPTLVFLRNLRLYQSPPDVTSESRLTGPEVSILIPARNEAANIAATVQAALASRNVRHEVVVLDDHSEDDTAARVEQLMAKDDRVRLETAPPLLDGWCGKQHACAVLATHARFEWLLFIDADVRLAPDAARRAVAFARQTGADLVSGVPHQETGSGLERLLIPLIHFILLGFLPLARMRASRHPAYGAGCGQFFLTTRDAYRRSGGHAAIPASRHDGLNLPRAYRREGLTTDLCDATELATCRMYRRGRDVLTGLAKNATEGIAAPAMIVPFTIVLTLGQVLPVVLVLAGLCGQISAGPTAITGVALLVSLWPRWMAARRFHQSWRGAVLHPLGVLVFLGIQWVALIQELLGFPIRWKGRSTVRPRVRMVMSDAPALSARDGQ